MHLRTALWFHETDPLDRFVTFFYAVIDTAAGTLACSNAGHNPPILVHADGSVSRDHAELTRSDGGWQVRDLGSTNHTRVGSSTVQTAMLEPGATLVVGDVGAVGVGAKTDDLAQDLRAALFHRQRLHPRVGEAADPGEQARRLLGRVRVHVRRHRGVHVAPLLHGAGRLQRPHLRLQVADLDLPPSPKLQRIKSTLERLRT